MVSWFYVIFGFFRFFCRVQMGPKWGQIEVSLNFDGKNLCTIFGGGGW